jgi:hypothetical protein
VLGCAFGTALVLPSMALGVAAVVLSLPFLVWLNRAAVHLRDLQLQGDKPPAEQHTRHPERSSSYMRLTVVGGLAAVVAGVSIGIAPRLWPIVVVCDAVLIGTGLALRKHPRR